MAPSHRWGQNFLVDRHIFDGIADLAVNDLRPAPILEIGPGLGGLTETLLERGATVLAIELDERVKPVLDDLAAGFPGRLTVVYGDALQLPWADLVRQQGFGRVTVVGNLPYYITAPLLGRLLESSLAWDKAIFMVQREVAERLLTEPGGRESSVLGTLLRYRMSVEPGLSHVPPESFYPSPEVFSSVIQLKQYPPLPVDWDAFRWAVRAGFQHRRKTLRQALAQSAGSPFGKNAWHEFLTTLGISSSARAEQLTLDDWIRIAASLDQMKRGRGSG